jgi:hypothetical protein
LAAREHCGNRRGVTVFEIPFRLQNSISCSKIYKKQFTTLREYAIINAPFGKENTAMDMQCKNGIKSRKKVSIGGVLCLIIGAAITVSALNGVLMYFVHTANTITLYVKLLFGTLTVETLFEFLFGDYSSIASSIIFRNGINLLSQLTNVTISCISAISFIVFGIMILLKKHSKSLVFFPIVQLSISVFNLITTCGSIVFSVLTPLITGNVHITNLYTIIFGSGILNVIPLLLTAAGYALLLILILINCNKNRSDENGGKLKSLTILIPVCIAGPSVLSLCNIIVSGVVQIIMSLFFLTRFGGLMSLILNLISDGIDEYLYVIASLLDSLFSTALSSVHHGLMSVLFALTFFLITKWIVNPTKKIK